VIYFFEQLLIKKGIDIEEVFVKVLLLFVVCDGFQRPIFCKLLKKEEIKILIISTTL
jgi:hypothetical protein